jgi:tRNA (guanine-N7-)-methyltransferase
MTEAARGDSGRVRTYVLRSGRMTDAQRDSYDNLLERYSIRPGTAAEGIEASFPRKLPLIVEIGFGMGAATVQIAASEPDRNFLGIEVHRPGVGKLLHQTHLLGLMNLKVIEADAVEVLESMIGPDSLAGIHLFFPDPWPKKRHHKRRIVQAAFAGLAASRLIPGQGYFHMATDWEDYALEALETLSKEPALTNPLGGFCGRPDWRPVTKFERRAMDEGRSIFDIHMVRRPAPKA